MTMAKLKHTKHELKAQREALNRFLRFLPMLQLKKQQLQMELQALDARIAERETLQAEKESSLRSWVALLAPGPEHAFVPPPGATPVPPIESLVRVQHIETDEGNIAGVSIPVLRHVAITRSLPDLFSSPPWYDDALDAIETLIRLRLELEVLRIQRERIATELRITSQRVNLFEKVKIPECRENIRIIKIFLGDEQTAGVVRGKLAKARTVASQSGAASTATPSTSRTEVRP